MGFYTGGVFQPDAQRGILRRKNMPKAPLSNGECMFVAYEHVSSYKYSEIGQNTVF